MVKITHSFVSGKAQGADPSKVYGPQWDDNHVVEGLENVDNTSDLDKPISSATQLALDNQQTSIDGKVDGPASAVDSDIAVFDGTTGKLIKNVTSTSLIADQATAEAGTDNTKFMSPQRVTQVAILRAEAFNVIDYGVSVDSADNADAMSAMIAAINATTNGQPAVFFPRGRYLFDSGPAIDLSGGAHGLHFYGEGNPRWNGNFGADKHGSQLVAIGSSSLLDLTGDVNAVQINNLDLGYSGTGYTSVLVDMDHSVSLSSFNDITIEKCRLGGLTTADANCAALFQIGGGANLTFRDSALCNAVIGITGGDSGANGHWVNGVLLENLTFAGTFSDVPMALGHQGWTIRRTSIEARVSDNAASGLRVLANGLRGCVLEGNFWQDATTTGYWIDCSSGAIQGSQITGNFFHNGAGHIKLGASDGLLISGNIFYCRSSTPPLTAGTSKNINATGNTILVASGDTLPRLFVSDALPTGTSIIDNNIGNNVNIVPATNFGGRAAFPASTLTAPSIILGQGIEPTSPSDGWQWYDGSHLSMRFGSVNKAFATTSDNLGAFATTTSAQLRGVISDGTGSGSLVFATSPTLVTPSLGAATATSLNGVAIDNNGWSTYTPTVTAITGSLTTYTATGRYKIIGKLLHIHTSVTVSNFGTATQGLQITPPSGVSFPTGSNMVLSATNNGGTGIGGYVREGVYGDMLVMALNTIANTTYYVGGVVEID